MVGPWSRTKDNIKQQIKRKNFLKTIDFWYWMWYNIRVVKRITKNIENGKTVQKEVYHECNGKD